MKTFPFEEYIVEDASTYKVGDRIIWIDKWPNSNSECKQKYGAVGKIIRIGDGKDFKIRFDNCKCKSFREPGRGFRCNGIRGTGLSAHIYKIIRKRIPPKPLTFEDRINKIQETLANRKEKNVSNL